MPGFLDGEFTPRAWHRAHAPRRGMGDAAPRICMLHTLCFSYSGV